MAKAKATGRVAGREHAGVTHTRTSSNGKYVSQNERVAAARARVQADRKRGVTTAGWIVNLAKDVG